MLRGNYAKIGNIDKQRLINAFENGRDYITAAENLGINKQTARNIIMKYRDTGRVENLYRGGNKRQKFDEEMVEFLRNRIENKITITLEELNEALRNKLPEKPYVTTQAISKRLDGMFISLKNIRNIPENWNSVECKTERREYAEWLMDEGINRNLIYVDEFGINVWTSRSKGRAPRGDRAVRIVNGQRGQNLTICLAVSPTLGLLHCRTYVGGMTQDRFEGFLIELVELMAILDEDHVIVCDNARAHNNPPNLGDHAEIHFLPRYSPFLNTCEMAGSALKAAIKRRLTEPEIQQEIHNPDIVNETRHDRRIRILRRETENSLDVITMAKCAQWNNHVLGYMPRCLREADILD